MSGGDVVWKVFIALLATFFTLCSACGLMFTFSQYTILAISIPCFLVFGVVAFALWRYFTRIGDDREKPTGLNLNG